MRRLSKWIITIVVMIGVFYCTSALADISGTCEKNLTWTLDDQGTLTISGTGEMDLVDGGPWRSWSSNITNVVIENGVTSIGTEAFSGCKSIKSITLPAGLTSIGSEAFYRCTNLASITLPDGLLSIENEAFYFCTNLTSITFPDGLTQIGEKAFGNCINITSVTLQNGLISVGVDAFSGCRNITSITLPNGLMSIGNEAFAGCSSLTSIKIPDGLTSIGGDVFDDNITIYANIGKNGAYTLCKRGYLFTDPSCPQFSLKYTFINNIPADLVVLGVISKDITDIVIPDNVTSIGDEAFSGCSSLKSITLPNGLTSIGNEAFYGCSSMTSITLPDGLTSIGWNVFDDEVTIYANIGKNGAYALSKQGYMFTDPSYPELQLRYSYADVNPVALAVTGANSDITNVTFPEEVSVIGMGAFTGCSKLKSLVIPNHVKTIATQAFWHTNIQSIVIPDSVINFGDSIMPGGSINDDIGLYDAIVYCYEDSVAEVWGKKHGFTVVLLDNDPVVPSIDMADSMLVRNDKSTILDVSIFPFDKTTVVEYTSSNESVATISDKGKITPAAIGETEITVSANGISKVCTVTVVHPAISFTIPDEIYVYAKASTDVQISNLTPDYATVDLVWTIGNTSYAKVDQNGRVTGMAISETTLTVTDQITGLSYTTNVYVIRPVSKVTFETKEVTVEEKETVQLKAIATIGSATYENKLVSFNSSEPAVATVDEHGLVTGQSAGTAIITATSENGKSDTCTVYVMGGPLDAPEISGAPAYLKNGEDLNLTLSGQGIEYALVTILDDQGNQVSQNQIAGTSITVPTGELRNGAYTISVQVGSSIHHLSDAKDISLTINNVGDDPAATTDLSLTIVWDDQEDIDGLRPATLVYQLNENAVTPTVTDWTAVLTGQPKYSNDAVIDYNWTVTVPDGYTQSDINGDGYATTITLSHTHIHIYQAAFNWSVDAATCGVTLSCEKGDNVLDEMAATIERNVTTNPTCNVEGEATYTAKLEYESVTYSESTTRPVEKLPHTPSVEIAGYAATCTEAGLTDKIICSVCQTLIQDQGPIEKLGHEWGEPIYEWAADNSSVTGKRICMHDATHVDSETVTEITVTQTEATCTEGGGTRYTSGPFQNDIYKVQTKLDAVTQPLGHTAINDHAVAPTCTETGLTAGSHCSVCGEVLVAQTVVPATGHTPVYGPSVEATCTADGIAGDSHCAVCGVTLTAQSVLPALGHLWGEPQYEWTADNSTVKATRICGRDSTHREAETVITTSRVSKPATCLEQGETTYTAGFQNAAFTVQEKTVQNIPALGHQWGEPQYEWAADNSTVTAIRICANDASHRETETVATTYAVTTEPSTLAEGVGTYTSAAFTNAAFTVQTRTVSIPKLPEEGPPTGPVTLGSDSYNVGADGTASYTGSTNSNAATVTIPETITVDGNTIDVTEISDGAFKGKAKLTTVTIGNKVKSIGKNAFNGCKSLTTVKGGKGVTTIKEGAFTGDVKLKTIPAFPNLKTIEANAFKGNKVLESATLGKNVEKIGKNAFNGCAKLKKITIKTEKLTTKNVGAGAFKGIDKKATIKCPKAKLKDYKKLLVKKGVPKTAKFKK